MGPGPELLLRRLTSAIWGRNGPELAAMFTTRCREGCRGYVPTPVAPVGSYKLARWIPDPRRRGLMITLAYLAQSHGHIRRVELTPMKARILPGQVHLRARLRVLGDPRKGDRRVDQGVIDLVLVKQQGAWKVDMFRPARLHSVWRADDGFHVGTVWREDGSSARPQRGAASRDHSVPGRVSLPPLAAFHTDTDGGWKLARGGRVVDLRPRLPTEDDRPLLSPRGGAPTRVLVTGDVDGDGRVDLFVGTYGGESGLWLNRPQGPVLAPGSKVSGHVTGAVLADLDGDGDLDLYVARHGPRQRTPRQHGEPNLLLLKTAKGYERRATTASGQGWSLAACGGDLDGDGDVDLMVANELGPARLWLNQGGARFVNASRRAGLTTTLATACAVGDADGDGRLDLLLGGRGARQRYLVGRPRAGVPGGLLASRKGRRIRAMMRGATLWLNRPARGGLRLVERHLPGDQWTAWAGMMDHDLDGRLDLLLLDGGPTAEVRHRWWWEALGPMLKGRKPPHILGQARSGPTRLLIRARSGLWLDAAPLSLFDPRTGGTVRGHVAAAIPAATGHGRLMLVWGGQDLRQLERGTWRGGGLCEGEHAVMLRLRAGAANRDAIGARVELRAGGRTQVRVSGLAPGMPGPPGYVHFGVGAALRAEAVKVRWPDGKVERHHDLPVDRLVTLAQGKAPAWQDPDDEEEPEQSGGSAVEEAPVRESGGEEVRASSNPLMTPLKLTVKTPAGEKKLSSMAGKRATLLLLSATALDSGKCRKLQALSRHRGVRLVEVRLGPVARGCLRASHEATAETAGALKGQRALLPLVAVVDGKGKVVKLLSGEPDPARTEAALLSAADQK